jgi:hypothetical protein
VTPITDAMTLLLSKGFDPSMTTLLTFFNALTALFYSIHRANVTIRQRRPPAICHVRSFLLSPIAFFEQVDCFVARVVRGATLGMIRRQ